MGMCPDVCVCDKWRGSSKESNLHFSSLGKVGKKLTWNLQNLFHGRSEKFYLVSTQTDHGQPQILQRILCSSSYKHLPTYVEFLFWLKPASCSDSSPQIPGAWWVPCMGRQKKHSNSSSNRRRRRKPNGFIVFFKLNIHWNSSSSSTSIRFMGSS